MKKIFLLSILAMFFWGCENGSVSFYVNDSSTSTIKSQLPINLPFNLPTPTITTNNTKECENNKTTPEMITAVSLEGVTISITSPANEDFSFIKSFSVSILHSDQSDSEEGVLIASLDNINSSDRVIYLTTSGANLVPYLKEDSYKLKTSVETKEFLTHDVDIKIDLKFKVTADLL